MGKHYIDANKGGSDDGSLSGREPSKEPATDKKDPDNLSKKMDGLSPAIDTNKSPNDIKEKNNSIPGLDQANQQTSAEPHSNPHSGDQASQPGEPSATVIALNNFGNCLSKAVDQGSMILEATKSAGVSVSDMPSSLNTFAYGFDAYSSYKQTGSAGQATYEVAKGAAISFASGGAGAAVSGALAGSSLGPAGAALVGGAMAIGLSSDLNRVASAAERSVIATIGVASAELTKLYIELDREISNLYPQGHFK